MNAPFFDYDFIIWQKYQGGSIQYLTHAGWRRNRLSDWIAAPWRIA
jgi:hypothetical protein